MVNFYTKVYRSEDLVFFPVSASLSFVAKKSLISFNIFHNKGTNFFAIYFRYFSVRQPAGFEWFISKSKITIFCQFFLNKLLKHIFNIVLELINHIWEKKYKINFWCKKWRPNEWFCSRGKKLQVIRKIFCEKKFFQLIYIKIRSSKRYANFF